MINRMSESISNFIIKNAPTMSERKEVLMYGCNTALYTIISTLGLLMVGFLFGKGNESIMIIGLFYFNQTIGGGVHANSHLKCFLMMCVFLMIALLITNCMLSNSACLVIACVGLLMLYYLPVVLHENKQYLSTRREKLTRLNKRMIIIESIVCLVMGILWPSWSKIILAGIVISFTSRMIVLLK